MYKCEGIDVLGSRNKKEHHVRRPKRIDNRCLQLGR
jgi:hypothetical protein